VHVADPSRWVAPGTPLAAEAQRRTKSLYLPTGNVPMFPKSLAEGPFRWAGVLCAAEGRPKGCLWPLLQGLVLPGQAPASQRLPTLV
jgi:exoribonuclease II